MAKKKANTTKTDAEFWQENVGKFLVVSYVVHVCGFLAKDREEKLDGLSDQLGTQGWKESGESTLKIEYGLDGKGVKKIFTACTKQMNGMHSLLFVLRGIGCAEPVASLVQLFGEDGATELGEKIVKKYPD